MPVEIRQADPSDYGRVTEVIDDWWGGREMAAMLPKLFFVHFRDTSFIAEDEGELAGFLCGFRSQTHGDEAYVHFVGVAPAQRESGLGRELYERFFAAIAPRNVVRAVTSPVNERSVEFHRAPRFRGRAGRRRLRRPRPGARAARQAAVGRKLPSLGRRRRPDADSLVAGIGNAASRPDDGWVGVPVYRGRFGLPQAERLLWRAGFGPREGEAQALAKLGLDGAVKSLVNPGPEKLVGPRPHDDKGRRLAPADAWGQDHCWWLDRMVRTSRPLVERMTLVWHDWFATSNEGVGSQRLMLRQNQLFRSHALGSFSQLLVDVTHDPAMLIWLNGNENDKDAPNENYAREMMELFTLGADRGAYTEHDVREQARSLTGWRNRWSSGRGDYYFHFDRRRHDTGVKRVFGKSGRFDWRDACHLCVQHPLHASFFVTKLWSYFVPVPPDRATLLGLEEIYRRGRQVKPVLQAILSHPAIYDGPRMVKPPVVFTAGLLRRIGAGITTTDWAWIGSLCGQQLFYPPNVAGWDDTRWLDTATFRGRWIAVERLLRGRQHDSGKPPKGFPLTADGVVARSMAFWNTPQLSAETKATLRRVAQLAIADAGNEDWKRRQYPVLLGNALRELIAISPDVQTS